MRVFIWQTSGPKDWYHQNQGLDPIETSPSCLLYTKAYLIRRSLLQEPQLLKIYQGSDFRPEVRQNQVWSL